MKNAHEQVLASKNKFLKLLQANEIDQELAHHVENINKELSQHVIEETMRHYFESNFANALSFTQKSIIGVKPDAEHAKHIVNRIFHKCLEGLIIRRNFEELDAFLTQVTKHYEG